MWSTIIIIYITIIHQMFNSSKFNKYVYMLYLTKIIPIKLLSKKETMLEISKII